MLDVEFYYVTTYIPLNILARMECRRYTDVRDYLKDKYGQDFYIKRQSICYAKSKYGKKNPALGTHPPNYIGLCSDGKGYFTVAKPDWYTGRKKYARVFYHHVVLCEALGLTEIPRGFCVHHIDGDRHNNNLNNLALMNMGAHRRLHHLQGSETSCKDVGRKGARSARHESSDLYYGVGPAFFL